MNQLRQIRAACVRIGSLALVAFALRSQAADPPKAPVPKSPYISVIYKYADTLIERGRYADGAVKTAFFLSALDRTTLSPLTNRPAAPAGVREIDRVGIKEGPLVGVNPQHDQNLLRLLYTLSELSGKPKYREAADGEIKWWLENATSVPTQWDLVQDKLMAARAPNERRFLRPWMLWDRCFDLSQAGSSRLAMEVREYWRSNQNTVPVHSPRQAGFYIRTWAVAYARTKDQQFLRAIELLVTQLEKQGDGEKGLGNANGSSVASMLSLAIDCDGAAHRLPEALAARLRALASRADELFCSLSHDLKNRRGFLTVIEKRSGKADDHRTSLWGKSPDESTTAELGMMCVSRYDNSGKIGYRQLTEAAADVYGKRLPEQGEDAWPVTFGQAISLQLAAWRSTARPEYLTAARELADFAREKFFGDAPLPRASLKSSHYETITGAATLALAFVELHLQILHITAVRCPPNTVDR